MPKGLKRKYGFGHLHFITFSCYRRLPLLRSARARHAFVKALAEVRREYEFKLVGYVVMPACRSAGRPEHVPLLISELRRGRCCTGQRALAAGTAVPCPYGARSGNSGSFRLRAIPWDGSAILATALL